MGFNNAGIEAYLAHLAQRPRGPVVLGANVGINKEGADPERDYPALIAAVAPHADYAVINVSSPNTPGLRDLQGEAQLRAILRAVAERVPIRPPVLVKIAPDIGDAALAAVVETCVAEGVQGLIVSNTTISRPPGLRSPLAREVRRPVRDAAVPALHHRIGARLSAGARQAGADRRRRRVHRRAGDDQDRRRCDAGATLHRVRLRRTGADPATEARTRRRAACRRFQPRAGRGGQGCATSGRIAADGTPARLRPARRSVRRLHPRSVGRHPRRRERVSARRRLPRPAARGRQAHAAAVQRAATERRGTGADARHGHSGRPLHRHPDQRRGGAARAAASARSVVGGTRSARVPPRPGARSGGDGGPGADQGGTACRCQLRAEHGAGRSPQSHRHGRVRGRAAAIAPTIICR